MKKGLLLSIIAVTAIIIVASFHMQIGHVVTPNVPESLAGNILYVCPVASSSWDSIATSLRLFSNYIIAGFFFTLVLLAFGWGWQLYQNMLSDKFKRESFKTIWSLTKIWFWCLVVAMLILTTPNALRRVEITNYNERVVLCEETDWCGDCQNGAKAVRAELVHAR